MGTISELIDRIYALIPENPQIMDMDSPWDLFKIPDFHCDDLGPSLAQAGGALAAARARYGRLNVKED